MFHLYLENKTQQINTKIKSNFLLSASLYSHSSFFHVIYIFGFFYCTHWQRAPGIRNPKQTGSQWIAMKRGTGMHIHEWSSSQTHTRTHTKMSWHIKTTSRNMFVKYILYIHKNKNETLKPWLYFLATCWSKYWHLQVYTYWFKGMVCNFCTTKTSAERTQTVFGE